ncbi:coiled-coil domain-containing protein 57-like isoform X2, partial [Lates japonicus]
MQSDGDSGMDLEAWLASKEREWKLQAVRVHQLESSLKKAQEECSSLREHYQQLWEDFQFNLAILDERDRELERYDVITARALTVEHNRQEELSQLHMQIAKVEDQRAREAEERQEELRKSRHSAAQHKLQLDKLKRIKELKDKVKQMETKLKQTEDDTLNLRAMYLPGPWNVVADFLSHQKYPSGEWRLHKGEDALRGEDALAHLWLDRLLYAFPPFPLFWQWHQQSGLTPKVDSLTSEEIQRLQEQNSILRTVVTQMRKNMEDLSHPLPHLQSQPQASSLQPIQHPGALAATSITPTANGGLFLEKCAKTSDLTKLEVTVAQTESASANIMEQSALVQQLQEENQHLRQQQISNQLESIQGARSNPLVMHVRLKQAVSCINRLSRENQQLIEMGNRLRAQITTAGIQEPVQPKKDSSTEKRRDQHDQLSALEQLQYQLTTQELQYALRKRDSTVAEQHLPKTNNQDPTTRGPANPWSQGHKTTNRSEISKNKENTPPFSQSHSSVNVEPEPHS